MNLIKSCHRNNPVSMHPLFTCRNPKQTANITHQIPNSHEVSAEDKNHSELKCECTCVCDCMCMYLGVESLGILGDSVELWETEHVLLAARPVKNPQCKGRQCGKNLQRMENIHAAI